MRRVSGRYKGAGAPGWRGNYLGGSGNRPTVRSFKSGACNPRDLTLPSVAFDAFRLGLRAQNRHCFLISRSSCQSVDHIDANVRFLLDYVRFTSDSRHPRRGRELAKVTQTGHSYSGRECPLAGRLSWESATFAMSRSGVRFPSAPPPAFERTGSHGYSWRNRRVFKGLSPDRAGNCGPETGEFPILAAIPPAVSGGGFFDHSFGNDANT